MKNLGLHVAIAVRSLYSFPALGGGSGHLRPLRRMFERSRNPPTSGVHPFILD